MTPYALDIQDWHAAFPAVVGSVTGSTQQPVLSRSGSTENPTTFRKEQDPRVSPPPTSIPSAHPLPNATAAKHQPAMLAATDIATRANGSHPSPLTVCNVDDEAYMMLFPILVSTLSHNPPPNLFERAQNARTKYLRGNLYGYARLYVYIRLNVLLPTPSYIFPF